MYHFSYFVAENREVVRLKHILKLQEEKKTRENSMVVLEGKDSAKDYSLLEEEIEGKN